MLNINKITVSLQKKIRQLQQQLNQAVITIWGNIEGNIDNQTDLKNALNNKANTVDVLTKANTVAYTPINDYHPATKKYVDNKVEGSPPVWGNITGTLSNQNDLQNVLNNKADIFHYHIISDVADLEATLNNKANVSHYHIISDITDLETILNNKVDLVSDQTIGGLKTFSNFPLTPSLVPTLDYQVANKKYVDDKADSGNNNQNIIKGNIHQNEIELTDSYVDIISKTLNINIGNTIQGELHGIIYNNSGVDRTYKAKIDINGIILGEIESAKIAADTYTDFWARFTISIISNSYTVCAGILSPLSASTGDNTADTFGHDINTFTNNFTGNQTVTLSIYSSGTGLQTYSGAGIITQIPQI